MRSLRLILIAPVALATAALTQTAPGWLGMAVRPRTPLVVDDVFPGGPAERAGVQPGDSLVQIGGRPATSRSVDSALSHLRIGAPVTLTVQRSGLAKVIHVTPDTRPSLQRGTTGLVVDVDSVRLLASAYLDSARRTIHVIAPTGFSAEPSDSGLILTGRGGQIRINVDSIVARAGALTPGSSYADSTGRQSMSVSREAGERVAGLLVATVTNSVFAPNLKAVAVASVRPDSPLAPFHLQPLDLIVEVNEQPTPDIAAFRRAVAVPQQVTTIKVRRKREMLILRPRK